MKKVLSLVLAVMMVVGMTTVAFAAFTPTTPTTITATQNWGTLTLGTAKSVSLGGFTNDTNAILNTNVKFAPTVVVSQPAGTPVDITKVSDFLGTITTSTIIEGSTSTSIKVALDGGATKAIPAGSYTIEGTLTDTATNTVLTYKNITFTVVEAAPVAPPVTGQDKVPADWRIKGFSDSPSAVWSPKSEIGIGEQTDKLPITAGMFTWEKKVNGQWKDANLAADGIKADARLTSSQLANVGVRRVYQKGTANTIKSVELKDSKSEVEVKTVKYYAKTGSTDVELKIALTFKSKTSDIVVANYSFTMENATETIEKGQKQAYSYGNYVLKAEDTVRDVEFEGDIDGIVFATKTVVKGQKYYFNVDSELSDDDAKIVADNPEVDSIYTVYSVNMANATVQFKNLDREFFVYDADGKLLGTTKDKKLPLASKYILTTAKVDFGGEEEPVQEPIEEPTEPEAPPMGGGEVEAPVNNYNPNTGL